MDLLFLVIYSPDAPIDHLHTFDTEACVMLISVIIYDFALYTGKNSMLLNVEQCCWILLNVVECCWMLLNVVLLYSSAMNIENYIFWHADIYYLETQIAYKQIESKENILFIILY